MKVNEFLDVSMNDDVFFKKPIIRKEPPKTQASTVRVLSTRGQSEILDASPLISQLRTGNASGNKKPQIVHSHTPSINATLLGGQWKEIEPRVASQMQTRPNMMLDRVYQRPD